MYPPRPPPLRLPPIFSWLGAVGEWRLGAVRSGYDINYVRVVNHGLYSVERYTMARLAGPGARGPEAPSVTYIPPPVTAAGPSVGLVELSNREQVRPAR